MVIEDGVNTHGVLILNAAAQGKGFCEILALNYPPWADAVGAAAPGAIIIWSNILSPTCSKTMLNAHCSWSIFAIMIDLYASGALCCAFANAHEHLWMDRIWSRILHQIGQTSGSYAPEAAAPDML